MVIRNFFLTILKHMNACLYYKIFNFFFKYDSIFIIYNTKKFITPRQRYSYYYITLTRNAFTAPRGVRSGAKQLNYSSELLSRF